jgi:hypothetical protein
LRGEHAIAVVLASALRTSALWDTLTGDAEAIRAS